jgi:hypothetical protein
MLPKIKAIRGLQKPRSPLCAAGLFSAGCRLLGVGIAHRHERRYALLRHSQPLARRIVLAAFAFDVDADVEEAMTVVFVGVQPDLLE